MDQDDNKAELMVLPLDSFIEVLKTTYENGFEAGKSSLSKEEGWEIFKKELTRNINLH